MWVGCIVKYSDVFVVDVSVCGHVVFCHVAFCRDIVMRMWCVVTALNFSDTFKSNDSNKLRYKNNFVRVMDSIMSSSLLFSSWESACDKRDWRTNSKALAGLLISADFLKHRLYARSLWIESICVSAVPLPVAPGSLCIDSGRSSACRMHVASDRFVGWVLPGGHHSSRAILADDI